MKKITTILMVLIAFQSMAQCDTVYIERDIDTLRIISDYLRSTNYILPQKKILQNGYPLFVKQQGVFIGVGAGINPAVEAIYNGVLKTGQPQYFMGYLSASYLHNRCMYGLVIGNGIVSVNYSRHIN